MRKLSLLLAGWCAWSVPLRVDAATATLVKDIRTMPTTRGEFPPSDRMAPVGSGGVFANNEGVYGTELWFSNGTTDGTRLLKDIAVGGTSSNPSGFVRAGALVFFKAAGAGNTELWRTDGTVAGTVQVKDICRGYCSSEINALTAFGTKVLFFAQDDLQGRQLWRSDGTEVGTYPVRTLGTATSGGAERIVVVQDKAFFTFASPTVGIELWVTDGTAAGTRIVKDIATGIDSSDVNDLQAAGSVLFFTAHERNDGTELWRSDGTETGTYRVKDLVPGTAGLSKSGVYRLRDGVVLMTKGPDLTDVLYLSRGNREDLTLIRDLGGVFDTTVPPVALGEYLYFVVDHPTTGRELWRTNGTLGGTGIVRDIGVGTTGSFPKNLTVVGGQLAFVATSAATGVEVWRSNGTADGTELLYDVAKGADGSRPTTLTELNGGLVFLANAGSGLGLYRSDMTTAGTRLVQSLTVGRSDSNPSNFIELNDKVLFTANDGVNGIELWQTDATQAGTSLLKDLCPGAASSTPTGFARMGTVVYFVASACNDRRALYRTDGTAAGTFLLKDVGLVSNPQRIGNRLYFSALETSAGIELWTSDGTPSGTTRLKDIVSGSTGSYPSDITPLNSGVLFTALTESGRELWKTDGTEAGTVLLKDLEPGATSSFPYGLTNLTDRVILFASGPGSTALWVTHGTSEGTQKIGSFSVVRTNPVVLGNVAYFVASDNQSGLELWKTDGTEQGTVRVADIAEGKASSAPDSLTVLGDAIYFTAHTPERGRELWKTTGTAEGTTLVVETFPGPDSGLNANTLLYAAPSSHRLVFMAADPSTNAELWATDGIPGHARRLVDLAPGWAPSSPREAFLFRDRLLFAADDGTSGFELFSLPTEAMDDLEPPQVTCPPTTVVAAASATGTVADYPPATGVDASGAPVSMTYSVASGSLFSVGTTTILVTATDAVGNSASCEFDLIVQGAQSTTAPPPTDEPLSGGCGGCSSAGFEWGPALMLLGLGFLRRRSGKVGRSHR